MGVIHPNLGHVGLARNKCQLSFSLSLFPSLSHPSLSLSSPRLSSCIKTQSETDKDPTTTTTTTATEPKAKKHHRRKMKLVWSPETASKAYIQTVQYCQVFRESGVAELVSAMAAGWNAQLIVETWTEGGVMETSMGLAIARGHTGGRHVCIVPDERSRSEYEERMGEAGTSTEIMVGEEAEEVMERLEGIDFMVVDCKGKEFSRVLRVAKLSSKGAVLLCKNANSTGFKWRNFLDYQGSRRVVRSVFLPVGKGLDITHVSAITIPAHAHAHAPAPAKRWIKYLDQRSGDLHVIRR